MAAQAQRQATRADHFCFCMLLCKFSQLCCTSRVCAHWCKLAPARRHAFIFSRAPPVSRTYPACFSLCRHGCPIFFSLCRHDCFSLRRHGCPSLATSAPCKRTTSGIQCTHALRRWCTRWDCPSCGLRRPAGNFVQEACKDLCGAGV